MPPPQDEDCQSGSLLAFPWAAVSQPKRALSSEQPNPWATEF